MREFPVFPVSLIVSLVVGFFVVAYRTFFHKTLMQSLRSYMVGENGWRALGGKFSLSPFKLSRENKPTLRIWLSHPKVFQRRS